MEERAQQMFKSKVCGSLQEVIFPDFPDDDNTVTTTVTKSRRVSFGTNFIKEFIVGSAISAQCVSEYEQAFSSSDSSNPNSSLSAVESGSLDPNSPFIPDNSKIYSGEPPIFKPPDINPTEPPKQTTFARTICFSADSPTVDMEFTEGCISLAKSILDKKNKEMTVIIQAKSKEPRKDDVTKIFDGSEIEMSMTRCLKSRENLQEGRRLESESTKIFDKFDDEVSITTCDRGFKMRQSGVADDSDFMMESSKENRMPLDVIMRQLDRDDSDTDLFNPEKSFSDMLNSGSFDSCCESEKLDLNESMDISRDIQEAPARIVELDAEIVKLPANEHPPALEQSHSEPLLMDVKVTETLKEQSKETNCLWTLQDVRYPLTKTPGLLSINFALLKSSTAMEFTLEKSKKRSIDSCSIITNKAIHFKEERTPIHPEYNQVLQFGFKKQQQFFNDCSKKLTAINEIPYFLDEINSYTRKINAYLEQIYEILVSYPGSVLKDTQLSFRLFSYPMFFSTTVTIDLSNLYTLSDTSLSFAHGIKKMNEKRIGNIFQNCIKQENCLCEFIIRSNKYLIDAERGTGYVSKRGHIGLLPEEFRL